MFQYLLLEDYFVVLMTGYLQSKTGIAVHSVVLKLDFFFRQHMMDVEIPCCLTCTLQLPSQQFYLNKR